MLEAHLKPLVTKSTAWPACALACTSRGKGPRASPMAARVKLGPFQGPAPHARRSRSRSGVIAVIVHTGGVGP